MTVEDVLLTKDSDPNLDALRENIESAIELTEKASGLPVRYFCFFILESDTLVDKSQVFGNVDPEIIVDILKKILTATSTNSVGTA